MKFNDVQTLESLLKKLNEYGASSGAPSYNSGGTSKLGKAFAATKAAVDRGKEAGKAIGGKENTLGVTSQRGSPNVTGVKPKEPGVVSVPARELDDGAVFKDEKGREVGTVVARLGQKPKFDKVVVQTAKGQYELYEPDSQVMVDEDISHDILKKITKKQATKKNSIARKIKRLSRQRLGEEELFEINFNKKELVAQALDAPVRCGFEAETSWPGLYGGINDDIDNYGWYEISDMLYISSSDSNAIDESFHEYISENLIDDYYDDIMNEKIEEARDEDSWYRRFMDESDYAPSEEAVDEYKENFKETDPIEFKNRREDGWDETNWMREYVDEDFEGEFLDFLREILDEDGEIHQEAFEAAESDTSIDEWIQNEFYSMTSFLDDFGIDYSELQGGDLEEIASGLEEWAGNNSLFTDGVDTGEYGSTHTDGWAVETDSSIESDGTGAEIISPVYSSPRLMLDEMRSLFNWIEDQNGETNNSTGLHVTMSWQGAEEVKPNKLKIAALLGDKYLLQTFGREKNSYAKQQSQNIKRAAASLLKQDSTGTEGFKYIEDTLAKSISNDKFSSINFKNQKDENKGNNLIEFRIGGGEDYHLDMAKIVKAVIRYATIMKAGYTDEYEDEYAKTLYRIVHTAGQIDKKDLDLAKDRYDLDNIKEPVVDLFKSMLSKENYFEGLGKIVHAYNRKAEYNILSQPGADTEWSKQVAEYEKGTGKKLDTIAGRFSSEPIEEAPGEVERGEPIRAYIQPDPVAPSKRAPDVLKESQDKYLNALATLAVDVALDKNRMPINAKSVGLIRKSIKDFELSNEEFSERLLQNVNDLNIPTQNDRTSQRIVIIKNGVDTLFRNNILKAPEFLTTPQSERIVKGVWNAIHTSTWSREENDELVDLLIKLNFGPDVDMNSDMPHNMRQTIKNNLNYREFNGFYSKMISSGYNSTSPPAQPGEIYYPDMFKKLIAFTSKYEDYNEPVSPSYNTNLFSDDSYIENYLNSYTMKLRKRFSYMSEIKDSNPVLWVESIPELGKITQELLKTCQPVSLDGTSDNTMDSAYPELKGTDVEGERDGDYFLAIGEYETKKINDVLDRIARKEYTSPFENDVAFHLGDRLTDVIRSMLGAYYKKKEEHPYLFSTPPMPDVIKERFAGIKDWMTGFDKIAQKMGFDSQSDEIAGKQNIEKREKEFRNDVQERPPAKINIPNGSRAFIRQDIYKNITNKDITQAGRASFQQEYKHFFEKDLNQSGVYVIPQPHWKQAEEAYQVKDTLDAIKDTPLGKSQQWRLPIANEIQKRFLLNYKTSWSALMSDEYVTIDYPERNELLSSGVEATTEGESENESPLVPWEKTKNPDDGTDFDRQQAAAKGVTGTKGFRTTPYSSNELTDYAINRELNPDELNIVDYAEARGNYELFDHMMQNGMNGYVPNEDTNALVGFLNNQGNDEEFKRATLKAIERNFEAGLDQIPFQSALAQARRDLASMRNESVFYKFNKLTLQEQISKLESIDRNKISNLHTKMFEKVLGRNDLYTDDRRQNFANMLQADSDFVLAGGKGTIKLDTNMADAFDNAEAYTDLPPKLTTADGVMVPYSTLEKTTEFGARAGGISDTGLATVSNKGEVAEGILGCGTFARLLVRPSAPVTAIDIENVIKQLPTDAPDLGGWHELTLIAQEIDHPIADIFTLTINLKSDTYNDFIDPKKWGVMQQITMGVAEYVNDNLEKYTNYFQANGKVDSVKVIADGVSGETDTKVDVFLTHSLDGAPERTLQHFDMSVKVGSTKQMGQVGGGKQTEPLTVRYSILKEMWEKFDVDISTIENDFVNAETVEEGYKIAYTEALRQLNSHLTSEEKEKDFLVRLLDAIKFFATLNDDRVKLVQFTDLKAGGYYVLDFKKLDRMMDKDRVDLEAKMIETAKHPKITIFNKVTGKDFLSVRMYQASSGYIRNYIEKEKGLVDLIKVRGTGMRKKVESVQETKKLNEIAFLAPALWSAARVAAPWLVRHGWKLVKGTSKVAVRNPKTAVAVGTGVAYKDEIAAVTEYLKGIGETIDPVLKYAKQYALPVMAVVALLYGGKKIIDMVKNKDPEMFGEGEFIKEEPYTFLNEFDVLSYIIGKDHVQQIFGQSKEPKRDTIGTKWLKLTLQKQNHLFDVDGTWREYILYLNDKLQPNNSDAGSSVQDMLKFAKAVAEGINQVSSIATQWQDAKSDLQDIKDLNNPEKYQVALDTARNSYKISNEEMNKAQASVIANLKPLIMKIEYFYQAMKVESIREGAVPNNDTIRKLKEIFAVPLMSNDIKGQMNAYICIPDPSMIRDFRAARSSFGDNFDLRSILKSYAKLKLHDTIKKQVAY